MEQNITNIILQHFDKNLLRSYFNIDYDDILYGSMTLSDFTNITGLSYDNLLDIVKDLPKNEEYASQALKEKNITDMKKKAYEELSNFLNNNYNSSMIIKCKIFDKDIIALIDTGATHSIISDTFIKKHNLEQYVDYHTETTAIGVGSTMMSSGMIWHTYLYMGGQCFPILLTVHNMMVGEGHKNIDMIIGMNILSLYDIKLVPNENKLILNNIDIQCDSY
jgi:hypothetical protein